MCDIEFTQSDVFRDTRRRARKPYRCSACGGNIEDGQLYTDHFSVFGGEWYAQKMCSPCEYSMRSFAKDHGRCTPSCLPDAMRECIDYEGASNVWWMTRALSAMRSRWARAKDGR
jgi:hypothetical protein